jgi:hypothetical protein
MSTPVSMPLNSPPPLVQQNRFIEEDDADEPIVFHARRVLRFNEVEE